MYKYRIIKKLGVKNIYLRVSKDGEITVSGGLLLTKRRAEKLINEKKHWIESKLHQLAKIDEKFSSVKQVKSFLYLGEEYPIRLIADSKKYHYIKVKFSNDILTIYSKNELSQEEISHHRDEFYRRQIKSVAEEIFNQLIDKTTLQPTKISYRKAKTRWGSCSAKNSISINLYLVALPIELLEYVILHELIHIAHKNHSQTFWNSVATYSPNYKLYDKQLKEYSFILS